MQTAIKFVKGAVSKDGDSANECHFVIENQMLRANNGVLAMCAPIPLNIDCKPNAKQFVKAVESCKDAPAFSITPAKRLKIASGKFKAFVDCIDEQLLVPKPEGLRFNINGESFVKMLKMLQPLIGDDVTRSWCNGILFKDQSAFVTNNMVVVEYWTGETFPHEFNLPKITVKELVKCGELPLYGQLSENSITFHYPDNKWIRSQLLDSKWPDLTPVLNKAPVGEAVKIDERLYEAISNLKPFADSMQRLYFNKDSVSTSSNDGEGASYDIEGFDYQGVYQMETFELIKPFVNCIHFASYPAPCLFYGDRLRGALVGMRM